MKRRTLLWLGLCSLGLITASIVPAQAAEPASDQQIRVMSFNIRYGTAKDGEHHWDHRRDFVLETIRAFNPDLLGTQETLKFQKDFLAQGLPEYATWGVGRDDGQEKGEMMAIFYRKDRFKKLDGGHFWYSETPEVPGSKSWDSSLPRLVSWLKLEDKQAEGKAVYFFNTHFDHIGKETRINSARLLKKLVADLAGNEAAIITGDFNAPEGSQPYQVFFEASDPQHVLIDTYRKVHPERKEDEKTAGGFRLDDKRTGRIDWVAVTPGLEVLSAEIDRTHKEGRTPSDHFPINVVLQWPAR